MAADQTIVVTGASSGIGRELAVQLASPGRRIWLIARNTERLEEVAALVRQRGASAEVVSLDLSNLEESSSFLEKHFPSSVRVHELYLVSAITEFGEVKDTLIEDWNLIYRTNLLAPFQWILHFYRNMTEVRAGRIVIVSSLAAYTGYPTAAVYATMKAALLGVYRSLVHEAKVYQVKLHLCSPGYVDTNIYKTALFRNTSYEKTMKMIGGMGFPVLSARDASARIIRSTRAGSNEGVFPFYASALAWLAPRAPWLIGFIHRKIIRDFHRIP